ncbi:MAG: mechanosensitive ion channel [Bacteroidales bacterium]|nr:mechanosensitive ion channel [Bacteroidales bacterium]
MIRAFKNTLISWFDGFFAKNTDSIVAADFTMFFILVLLSFITYFIARRVLLSLIHQLTKKSKTNWDDKLADRKFFKILSYLVPAYIIYVFTPVSLESYPDIAGGIRIVLTIYMIAVVVMAANAFLNAVVDIYHDFTIAKHKPIKGYVQVAKILVYIIGIITIIANLFGQNPLTIIGGLGAFSAVLLLIFKDPILGFVAGIQLSAYNMLQPGDWISMPKFDTDGTVIDVSLTTVKVQNWDKTISTIPTYSLISDSYKNWRGMEESGGRRIKRAINLDMKSVKFCTPEMLEKFRKFEYVKKYIHEKEAELSNYNEAHKVDNSVLVNGRRQTNLGVFRAYLRGYLNNHPDVHDEMTFLVRQLQPSEKGIPMEIYVFSRIQEWAKYENLQADIFDHILAVIPEFDLRVYQNPTGDDLQKIGLPNLPK